MRQAVALLDGVEVVHEKLRARIQRSGAVEHPREDGGAKAAVIETSMKRLVEHVPVGQLIGSKEK